MVKPREPQGRVGWGEVIQLSFWNSLFCEDKFFHQSMAGGNLSGLLDIVTSS